ncbi:MAG: DNA polymerase I, partial [Clostridia bacterium]|nr:DNA polymerase I [Clostridia bacterium]
GYMFYYFDDDVCYASTDLNDITLIDVFELKPYFENENIKKISHNIKEQIIYLHSQNINFENPYFDTMIAYYVVNPSATDYSLDTICLELSGNTDSNKIVEIINLYNNLKDKIEKDGQNKLFYEIEMPLVEVLASMQLSGVKVDKDNLVDFQSKLAVMIDEFTEKIYSCSGVEFNINSPKQLGEVLFDTLHLPVVKKTKSGYSTSVEVLEKLRGTHEIIEYIMEYRHIVKLKGTYADGLLSVIDKNTGKIHSNFNQTVTVTGRISSTEPNLQNIPIRTELGREVRKMFVASDDEHILVDADYSQIELRVLAHISDDKNMLDAFNNNQDIHTRTASQIFDVEISDVTSQMRSRAKTVNFGIVYGMGDFSLAQELGIKKAEAKEYINNYFINFSGVKEYMENIVETAKNDGYVSTLFNRRRYLPELNAGNFIQRSFGERVAMNTPIQGSAADIIKIAMVNIYKRLKSENLKSRLVLQVHDELIIDTYKSELEQVKSILKYEMENAVKLKVPLLADMNVGETWYEAK